MAGTNALARKLWGYPASLLYKKHLPYAVPRNLGICLSDKCNIRCPYYMREEFKPPKGTITLAQVKDLVHRMPYLEGVCIMGLCEPFLNPETPDILRWIKDEAGLSMSFTTNGMVELTEDRLDALTRVDDFVFSMDTSDPETFKILRGGANFDTVMENLLRLLEYKRARKLGRMDNPPVHINAVITSQNFAQIPDLIKLLEPYAEEITYLMVDPVTRPDFSHFEEPLMLQQDIFREHIDEYRAIAKASPLQVVGFDYMFETSSGWGNCHLSWHGMFIHPNGDAYFCYHYEYLLGNVFEKSPLAVWNSKAARQFRKDLESCDAPLQQCHTCNFARTGWQLGGVYDQGKEDVLD